MRTSFRLVLILLGLASILLGVGGILAGDRAAWVFVVAGLLLTTLGIKLRKKRHRVAKPKSTTWAKAEPVMPQTVPAPKPAFVPVCPYCKSHFKNRKPPKRRSAFKCPTCKEQISVDPEQYVYPSSYLTEKEAGYLRFLYDLDYFAFSSGSYADYGQMHATLAKRFGRDPGVSDIIWGLMNLSQLQCLARRNQKARELAHLRVYEREFGPLQGDDNWELDRIRDLMKEFHEFEKRMKSERKKRRDPKG